MADEVEARLAKLRRAMARMAAQGREREFAALDVAYEALKGERDEAEAARLRAERVRVRRVAERPVGGRRWRLPPGFSSPLAASRARSGWQPREEPVAPAGGLSPWRRYGGPMTEVVWRPGAR